MAARRPASSVVRLGWTPALRLPQAPGAIGLMLLASWALGGAANPARAQQQLPLECRLGGGAWRACTMTIARAGELWWLQVGPQKLEFRSDGRGAVTLTTATGNSRQVVPAWQADRALCWDGICARGEFPLD